METALFSVALEGIVSRLIDNLRKSATCKSECKKLEQVVGKNRLKLDRLAKGLDRSKRNGQVWVALDEWCEEMKDLLVRANEIVHECQSGSRPFNLMFSASLATRIVEIRTRIEDKLNHSATLETYLEQTANLANAQQQTANLANAPQQSQFHAANSTMHHHGYVVVQTTSPVLTPLQYSVSMPHLQTMQYGWDEHFSGASPSSVHSDPSSLQHGAWESPGTTHYHHSHSEVGMSTVEHLHHSHSDVGMSTVEHDRRHSWNHLPIPGSHRWQTEVDDIKARERETREPQRRNSISVLPHCSALETSSQYLPSAPPVQPSAPPLPCCSGAPNSMMYSPTQ